ncbi:MAG: undecaprenyl-diphosphate phosphatase [Patescibacteria group bacterium]
MEYIEAILLGMVQGLTEFIPISSSGHLVLFHRFFGAGANDLALDVALHIGTLFALLTFFYKDIIGLVAGFINGGYQRRLVWLLAGATFPAVVVGVALESRAETAFRSVTLVAVNLLVVGIIMLLAENHYDKSKFHTKLEKLTAKQAAIIGVAQAVAIVPGISRSGSTITSGLFVGLDRIGATRFSFLLALPITFGAVLKVMLDANNYQALSGQWNIVMVGIVASLFSGLYAIGFMLRFLAKYSLRPFAYYRIVLGAVFICLSLR